MCDNYKSYALLPTGFAKIRSHCFTRSLSRRHPSFKLTCCSDSVYNWAIFQRTLTIRCGHVLHRTCLINCIEMRMSFSGIVRSHSIFWVNYWVLRVINLSIQPRFLSYIYIIIVKLPRYVFLKIFQKSRRCPICVVVFDDDVHDERNNKLPWIYSYGLTGHASFAYYCTRLILKNRIVWRMSFHFGLSRAPIQMAF